MFQKRIFIEDIENYNEGMVCGRIESSDKNEIFLSDQTGICKFNFASPDICPAVPDVSVKNGDIIALDFYKDSYQNRKILYIKKILLLNAVEKNPLADRNSLYVKLNKNDKNMITVLKKRQVFFQETRNFFTREDFIEINTPTLVDSPGVETYIEPFKTTYYGFNGDEKEYFMPTSPEFSLKEALTSGLEKIFEIAKVFRNRGENSNLHSPEFFMLEWYRAYSDYSEIINDCFLFIKYLANSVYKIDRLLRGDRECKIDRLKKVTIKELFLEYEIDTDDYFSDEEKFKENIRDFYQKKHNEKLGENLKKDDLFFKFFLDNIEPNLGFDRVTCVYEYPIDMCALSNPIKNNEKYGERFELYIFGIEIANGFGELIDPKKQEMNFQKILKLREENETLVKQNLPERFLKALRFGLPPCSGVALGIERLFMIFENIRHIKDANLLETFDADRYD